MQQENEYALQQLRSDLAEKKEEVLALNVKFSVNFCQWKIWETIYTATTRAGKRKSFFSDPHNPSFPCLSNNYFSSMNYESFAFEMKAQLFLDCQ